MDITSKELTYTPGVGPKKAQLLERELGLASLEDLLYYFPYRYIDRSKVYKINELNNTQAYVQLKGVITRTETVGTGVGRRFIAYFTDGTGTISLIWFKGIKFVKEKYDLNRPYIVFGKPSVFNRQYTIAHPDVETPESVYSTVGGLQPLYNTTEKMKNAFLDTRNFQKLITSILDHYQAAIDDTLPEYLLQITKLIPLDQAIRLIHRPSTPKEILLAEARLKFDELFYIQLNLLRFSQKNINKLGGHRFPTIGDSFHSYYQKHLPFELTGAQKRVIKEIRSDVGSGRQMNRLLQGDVGSGKTIVALMCMLMAVDNGFQACIMAPTEILSTQHYQTISEQLSELNIHCALLTGSTKKKDREPILEGLRDGSIHIVIGTHALLEDSVNFRNLGLAVIDEQHRFGVLQRARLWNKNTIPPHILVMTATPIPRTLAMTLYGDLDVSIIDELPPGRKPIMTIHQPENRRKALFTSIRKQLELGRQAYFVYPLIEESERVDYKNLQEGFEILSEVFSDYTLCMVHGKMKPQEKEAAMMLFKRNEAQIMVATTVIEVGVNVPNATIMVIENAERFGLSQLHQLRGRVGRGGEQSYCVLSTQNNLSEESRKRMEIMCQSNDGFVIAEADLQLRGPGDLEGVQQSGVSFNLRIANLAKDGQIISYARSLAEHILKNDPLLEHPANALLQSRLTYLNRHKADLGRIS